VEFPPAAEAPAKYRGFVGKVRPVRGLFLHAFIHLDTAFFIAIWPLDCHPVSEALGAFAWGQER
jgi:hypothetical protein